MTEIIDFVTSITCGYGSLSGIEAIPLRDLA